MDNGNPCGEEGWPLVRAAEMRALDEATIQGLGVPGELLMEVAGQILARRVSELLGMGGSAHILTGRGNNGGDGWVAARLLHLRGVPVCVIPTVPVRQLGGDAEANARRAERVGVPRKNQLRARAGDVIVDALFGTGLSRPVEGEAAAWITQINERAEGVRALAVDLPSGLHADTGQVLGVAVRADATLTLGLPKLGLTFEPGRERAGQITVARIGIADHAEGIPTPARLVGRRYVATRLPSRPSAGHKGRFGHLLVVGGSQGMTGAPALAARGAARSGAGLVTVAGPAGLNPVMEGLCVEAMTAPVAETPDHALSEDALKSLQELAASRSAVVLGPGIGRGAPTAALVARLVPDLPVPLILDADGLHAIREDLSVLKGRHAATIVTPHPGEAAVLLGTTPGEVLADRPGAAMGLAEATGSVVVLKGAGTVMAEPQGRMAVNPTGGPALGTGGTGDVLAGVIGGLVAQGLAPFEAAACGAYLHGAAGDRWVAAHGDAGLLASEVADALPGVLDEIRSAPDSERAWQADEVAFPEPC